MKQSGPSANGNSRTPATRSSCCWSENIVWQLFSGREYYEARPPCDVSQVVRLRRAIGEDGLEQLLKATIECGRHPRRQAGRARTRDRRRHGAGEGHRAPGGWTAGFWRSLAQRWSAPPGAGASCSSRRMRAKAAMQCKPVPTTGSRSALFGHTYSRSEHFAAAERQHAPARRSAVPGIRPPTIQNCPSTS